MKRIIGAILGIVWFSLASSYFVAAKESKKTLSDRFYQHLYSMQNQDRLNDEELLAIKELAVLSMHHNLSQEDLNYLLSIYHRLDPKTALLLSLMNPNVELLLSKASPAGDIYPGEYDHDFVSTSMGASTAPQAVNASQGDTWLDWFFMDVDPSFSLASLLPKSTTKNNVVETDLGDWAMFENSDFKPDHYMYELSDIAYTDPVRFTSIVDHVQSQNPIEDIQSDMPIHQQLSIISEHLPQFVSQLNANEHQELKLSMIEKMMGGARHNPQENPFDASITGGVGKAMDKENPASEFVLDGVPSSASNTVFDIVPEEHNHTIQVMKQSTENIIDWVKNVSDKAVDIAHDIKEDAEKVALFVRSEDFASRAIENAQNNAMGFYEQSMEAIGDVSSTLGDYFKDLSQDEQIQLLRTVVSIQEATLSDKEKAIIAREGFNTYKDSVKEWWGTRTAYRDAIKQYGRSPDARFRIAVVWPYIKENAPAAIYTVEKKTFKVFVDAGYMEKPQSPQDWIPGMPGQFLDEMLEEWMGIMGDGVAGVESIIHDNQFAQDEALKLYMEEQGLKTQQDLENHLQALLGGGYGAIPSPLQHLTIDYIEGPANKQGATTFKVELSSLFNDPEFFANMQHALKEGGVAKMAVRPDFGLDSITTQHYRIKDFLLDRQLQYGIDPKETRYLMMLLDAQIKAGILDPSILEERPAEVVRHILENGAKYSDFNDFSDYFTSEEINNIDAHYSMDGYDAAVDLYHRYYGAHELASFGDQYRMTETDPYSAAYQEEYHDKLEQVIEDTGAHLYPQPAFFYEGNPDLIIDLTYIPTSTED